MVQKKTLIRVSRCLTIHQTFIPAPSEQENLTSILNMNSFIMKSLIMKSLTMKSLIMKSLNMKSLTMYSLI